MNTLGTRLSRESLRNRASERFASLRVYNFRVYFLGQSVSQLGSWMQNIGQAWLILDLTGSAGALGLLTAVQFLPFSLLTLLGGVLADRVSRRKLLMTTLVFQLAQAVALGALVVLDLVQVWHVYLFAIALGTVGAIDNPSRQAFVHELVGREHLVNAVALNAFTQNVSRVLGPALGGLTVAAFGVGSVFFVNALTFVAVLVAYAVMRPAEFHRSDRPPRTLNVFGEVAEGFRYALRTPLIVFVLITVVTIGSFGHNFSIIVPLTAEFILGVGAGGFGFLASAVGVGAVLAAFSIAGLKRPSQKVLLAGAIGFIIVLPLLAVSRSYALTAALFVLMGMSGIAFTTTATATLQLAAPDELRGRVMSIYLLLFMGGTPLGGFTTGALTEAIGVPRTFHVLAALCAIGVAAAVAYRRSRPAEPRVVISAEPAPGAR